MTNSVCVICGNGVVVHSHPNQDVMDIACHTCGNYSITGPAEAALPHELTDDERFVLSGLLRQESDHGNELRLDTYTLQATLDSAAPPADPIEAIDRILEYVRLNMSHAAALVTITGADYSIAYAKGQDEFDFLLKRVCALELLEYVPSDQFRLTLRGWERLAERTEEPRDSSQAFVAMWFKDKTKDAWESGFKPALDDTGYTPIRIDLVQHNDKIDDRIIAEIRKSGLLVADLTGVRGGVYFEAGFALGLGIPVIWTCHKDYVGALHFDTRQYNHIVWASPAELKEKLVARIEATLPRRSRRKFI